MGKPMLGKTFLGFTMLFLLQVPSHTRNAASTGPIVSLEFSLCLNPMGTAMA
jgi:hypothetical protein